MIKANFDFRISLFDWKRLVTTLVVAVCLLVSSSVPTWAISGGGGGGSGGGGNGTIDAVNPTFNGLVKVFNLAYSVNVHGGMGVTEAFNASKGVHTATLDHDCLITLSGWAATGYDSLMVIRFTQDSTGGWALTWPAAVNVAPTINPAANSVTYVSLETTDGGVTIDSHSDYAAAGTAGSLTLNNESEAYNASTWNGNFTVPTKDEVRDKLEALDVVQPIALSDEVTALTTGTAKVTWRAPFAFTLTSVRASVNTVSSSGLPTVNVKESGTTVFSTNLTIDANEKTSVTAVTAAVISDSAIADDAELTFDIVTAGTGTKGLKICLYGHK